MCYGVLLSLLDAESKGSSFYFGGIFLNKFLFDDVDWTRAVNIGYEGTHSAKKNQGREQLTKKSNDAQKIPTSKSHSHNNSISQITVGSMIKILAPWTLKPKIRTQITEKLF